MEYKKCPIEGCNKQVEGYTEKHCNRLLELHFLFKHGGNKDGEQTKTGN